ncbi:unnamed protein product [Effrenium voratum]|uniref:DOMON domain-containing protein n=1 Tax=Effrenium voratum TaxID=2562239 RepID=A0AA36HZZ0_9DINO|nr:unnamed protein product [Effrenium voratum]
MAFLAGFVLLGAAEAAVHSGYLYDKLCVDEGVGIDGVDSRTEPEKHTLDCLLFSPCIESGYGILTRPEGQSHYSMDVLLSAQGNADVITWLTTQEYLGNHVEISGLYDSQGRLHVDTIKRLNDGSIWNGSGEGSGSETSTFGISTSAALVTSAAGCSSMLLATTLIVLFRL